MSQLETATILGVSIKKEKYVRYLNMQARIKGIENQYGEIVVSIDYKGENGICRVNGINEKNAVNKNGILYF